jgi:Domain of unknown function (DUF4232)
MGTPGMKRVGVLLGVAASIGALAGCGGAKTVTVTVTHTVTTTRTVTQATTSGQATSAPACSGNELTGSFDAIPNSAGAGNISYELTLTNNSKTTCYVSGIPSVQLLDASGNPLPTHATAAHPGQALAAQIVLAPGTSAYSQARFSPDVPGIGESQTGKCEPTATTLRVTPGGPSTVSVPIKPPTSVCEQGQLNFELLASSK